MFTISTCSVSFIIWPWMSHAFWLSLSPLSRSSHVYKGPWAKSGNIVIYPLCDGFAFTHSLSPLSISSQPFHICLLWIVVREYKGMRCSFCNAVARGSRVNTAVKRALCRWPGSSIGHCGNAKRAFFDSPALYIIHVLNHPLTRRARQQQQQQWKSRKEEAKKALF